MLKTSREKVVKNAEKYVSRGKIDAGIKEYRKLLDENPNDISTLNRVGDLYARIDRPSEAIELFEQIAKQYDEDGFLVKAIAIYKKIIKLDPTLLEIYEKLADLYHRQGLVNEARTQYQVLADYYVKHDKPASAISVYERMVQLEPSNPSNHAKLADLYQKQELFDEALGEFKAIAELMLEHGRTEEAAQVYERGLAVSAEDIGFITDAVLKIKEAGNVAAAARLLAIAVERNPQAESVARIAGLDDPREGTGTGTAPAAAEEPAAVQEPAAAEEPSTVEESAAADEEAPLAAAEAGAQPEAAAAPSGEETDGAATEPVGGESTAPGEPVLDVDAVAEEEAGADVDLSELELEGFEDDEKSSAFVQPPADMLEDRDRPGAAWSQDEASESTGAGTLPGETAEAGSAQAEYAAPEAFEETEAEAEEGTGAFEFELDLEADGDELLELTADADTGMQIGAEELEEPEEPADDLDHDLLERTAAEVEPEPTSGPDDLFTEAEVLAKYGIAEKALERLADLLHRQPQHLEGYRLMVGIHLDAERHDRAASVATRMAEVAAEVGDEEVWPEVRDRLEEAGHRVEGDRVTPPSGTPAEPELAETPSEDEIPAESSSEIPSEAQPPFELEPEPASEPEPEPEPVEPRPEAAAPEEPDSIELEPGDLPSEPPEEIEVELDEDRFELPEVPPPAAPSEPPPAEAGADEAEEAASGEADEAPAAEPEAPAAEPEDLVPAEPEIPSREVPQGKKGDRIEAALAELSAEYTTGRTARRRPPATPGDGEPPPSPEAPSAPEPTEPPPAAEGPPPEPEAPEAPAEVASPEPPAEEPSPPPQEPAAPAPPAAASGEAAPAGALDPLRALGASLQEEIGSGAESSTAASTQTGAAASGNGGGPAAGGAEAPREETDPGMSWLDEVPEPAEEEDLFAGEEDFFDLGAELEQELTAEGGLQSDEELLVSGGGQSLEDIVEGFKRGVAENLSSEDYDTHFNLGIAYREMSLLDEAIGEFQLAAKHPDYLVECASMLGLCFLEKGLPELAVKWYRRGLEAPDLAEEDQLGLLYDLGNAQAAGGEEEAAYHTFVDLYGINTNYRDVVARLAELEPREQSSE